MRAPDTGAEGGEWSKPKSFKETEAVLKDFAVREAMGRHILPAETAFRDEVYGMRAEWIRKAKERGVITKEMKDGVARLEEGVANRWEGVEGMAREGYPKDMAPNPSEEFAQGIERLKDRFDEPGGDLEGVVEAWLDGVVRNVEFVAAEEEARWREVLNMSPDRVLNTRRAKLGRQKEMLDWGDNRDITVERITRAGTAMARYEEIYGRHAAEYKQAAELVAKGVVRERSDNGGRGVYRAERAEPVLMDSVFDAGFLEAHGLPEKIFARGEYTERGLVAQGHFLVNLLNEVYLSGKGPEELQLRNLQRAVTEAVEDPRERAQRLMELNKAWGELVDGVIPLIGFRLKFKSGKFEDLGGSQKVAGLLEAGKGLNLNIKDVVAAWRNDETAKRALGMWMAMDGGKVGRMSREDQAFANRYKREFEELLRTSPKDPDNLQAGVDARMQEIAREMAGHLGCGEATPNLMLSLGTILGVRPLIGEYRKIYTDGGPFQTLAEADRGNAKELVLRPMMQKIKLGDGEKSFGYVAKRLEREGVDGLFAALNEFPQGQELGKYWGGMAVVMEAMKTVKLYEEGADDFPDFNKRKGERDKLLTGLISGEIPFISMDTFRALRNRRVYPNKGKAVQVSVKDQGRNLVRDFLDAWK